MFQSCNSRIPRIDAKNHEIKEKLEQKSDKKYSKNYLIKFKSIFEKKSLRGLSKNPLYYLCTKF